MEAPHVRCLHAVNMRAEVGVNTYLCSQPIGPKQGWIVMPLRTMMKVTKEGLQLVRKDRESGPSAFHTHRFLMPSDAGIL